MNTAPNKQHTESKKEKTCADVDRLERQAFGEGIP
jgi:hypothetical protein